MAYGTANMRISTGAKIPVPAILMTGMGIVFSLLLNALLMSDTLTGNFGIVMSTYRDDYRRREKLALDNGREMQFPLLSNTTLR